MRFLGLLIFLFLFYITLVNAQSIEKKTTEAISDTIEGLTTDTSIIYIIKKPPVKIREKVEIERAKKKRFLHLTLGLSAFTFSDKYKAKTGSEDFTNLLNKSTNSNLGYGTVAQIYQAPKKIIIGISSELKRYNEKFNYVSIDGTSLYLQNSYTYCNMGITIGRWFRKKEKISFQLLTIPSLNYKIGVSGYSLDKKNTNITSYIAEAIDYKIMIPSFSIELKCLYKTKNGFVELVPKANIFIGSSTKTTEIFNISRNSIGFGIYYTNKLF